MGILNVTPDSFYDGGSYFSVDAAKNHALQLIDEGADILDIGGCSTRPGSDPVDPVEEISRVIPVIKALRSEISVPISIDTTSSITARAALDAGASWVNDVSAGRFDNKMPELLAEYQCNVILMHSRGNPKTMQISPHYENVVHEVQTELKGSVDLFLKAGVNAESIVLDPGIGFAKNFDHNEELIRKIDILLGGGYPILLAASRKAFIGNITGKKVEDRLAGSLGVVAAAFEKGVTFFRVHDVAATRDLLLVLSRLRG